MAADNVMVMEQATDQMRSDQAEVAQLYQGYLGALLASGQAMVGSCQTVQGALLAFLQSRAKESLAAGQRRPCRPALPTMCSIWPSVSSFPHHHRLLPRG